MADATDLDHVAVAAETWDHLWPRYAGELGGEWLAGGPGYGFMSAQVRYANGMRVEALAPHAVDVNDFLRRFLDSRGPGPHHLTFKVPDLDASLARAERAGYRPVGVDRTDPDWQEAFLHPKDAPGVVVQLAQAVGDWASPPPAGFPADQAPPATLEHVAHGVIDLDEGLRLFGGLLDGEEYGRGHDQLLGSDWVDLRWPGPGRIRLLTPTTADAAVRGWIGEASGRLHHLAFTLPDPETVAEAKPTGDARYEVAPEVNLGTRLILTRS